MNCFHYVICIVYDYFISHNITLQILLHDITKISKIQRICHVSVAYFPPCLMSIFLKAYNACHYLFEQMSHICKGTQ